MRAVLVIMVASGLPVPLAAAKPGDAGTPEFEKAAALVKQLGHPRFALREAAGKQLVEMGWSAAAALAAGTKATDDEVRTRSIALLARIKAAELRRRADAYAADAVGKDKHDLPLLAEWEKLVGKPDAGSRRLFADMVRSAPNLLDAVAADAALGRPEVEKRTAELWATARFPPGSAAGPPAADVAAVLFAQTVAEAGRASVIDRSRAPAYLLRTPPAADAAEDPEIGRAFRLLLVKWAESRPFSDPAGVGLFIEAALRHRLPEAVPQLARLARKVTGGSMGGRALAAIVLAGGPGAREALEGMLADDTVVLALRNGAKPQLRDCALAELVKLNSKDPMDFGLTVACKWDPSLFCPVTIRLYTFATDEARTMGLAKWRAEAPKK